MEISVQFQLVPDDINHLDDKFIYFNPREDVFLYTYVFSPPYISIKNFHYPSEKKLRIICQRMEVEQDVCCIVDEYGSFKVIKLHSNTRGLSWWQSALCKLCICLKAADPFRVPLEWTVSLFSLY